MPRQRSSSAEQVDRDNRALALRRKGASYADIGRAVGFRSTSSAYDAVRRALALESAEDRDTVRKLELSKLDALERAAWKVLERFHYVVITTGEHAGDIVYSPPEDGDHEPLIDDAPVLAAIDRILRCSESRRRLLGIDAPRKSQVSVLTEDAVTQAIRALEEELASVEAPAP